MNTTRLGCLSGSGILATLITLVVISSVAIARGGVLFNPGELNAQTGAQSLGGVASHAETGGRCSACHTAIWENDTMMDRCLDCHTDVMDVQSFHNVMLAQSQSLSCKHCHTDHRGFDAPLTVMDLTRFPHIEVGYALDVHQRMQDGRPFVCTDCHGGDISVFTATACETCHLELDSAYMTAHLVDFGPDCLACHDGLETYGRGFDHNQTTFPLVGNHVDITCNGCHSGARSLTDLQTTAETCYACHAADDIHTGQFGGECVACHSPTSWKEAEFDHSFANFPLTGAHINVECKHCHPNNLYQGTPQECYACHQDNDVHQGQFGQGCQSCHTTSNWETAEFDHSLSNFTLTGAHVNVDCAQCHVNDIFKGTRQECFACHAEPDYHRGLLNQACASCHDTNAWSPAKFDQPHTFPINHGEAGWNACSMCHPANLSIYTCYGCHEHAPANIESKHREEGVSNFENCVDCHPTGHEHEGSEGSEGQENGDDD